MLYYDFAWLIYLDVVLSSTLQNWDADMKRENKM